MFHFENVFFWPTDQKPRGVTNVYLNHRVSDANHVLCQVLDEGEEAPLGVEPRIRAQLLVVRLQRFDHPGDAELVVALGAVQRSCGKSSQFEFAAIFQISFSPMTRLTMQRWKTFLSGSS